MTKLHLLLEFRLFVNISCANNHMSNALQAVSIMDLKINPEKYINKHIHVVGYLSDFPTTLYITKEYERLSIGGDSLKIVDSTLNGDFVSSDCVKNYVAIIGEFKKSNPKHDNSTYYYLTNIAIVKTIENETLEFCYRKQKD